MNKSVFAFLGFCLMINSCILSGGGDYAVLEPCSQESVNARMADTGVTVIRGPLRVKTAEVCNDSGAVAVRLLAKGQYEIHINENVVKISTGNYVSLTLPPYYLHSKNQLIVYGPTGRFVSFFLKP